MYSMILMSLVCFVDFDINQYFDKLYSQQLQEAKQVKDTQRVQNLTKFFMIKVPTFDFFDKGVFPNDLGIIGEHYDPPIIRNNRIVSPGFSTARSVKVLEVHKDYLIVDIQDFGGSMIKNLPGKFAIEQIVYLDKFVFRYDGRQENYKVFTVVGTEADLIKWKQFKKKK